ncbi:hypothetical protein C8R43DRAFT_1092270 [Mycena crocata]|nr:hypothetical protein C8R43DRAFT_1092270 [Mycena crocata]
MPQVLAYQCPDCPRSFSTTGGLTRHKNLAHRKYTPAADGQDGNQHTTQHHPKLNAARLDEQPPGSWSPFSSRTEFDFANFHFVEAQSSEGQINTALDLWTAQVLRHNETAPWKRAKDLYKTIDAIQHGDAPWKVYKLQYTGPKPAGLPPKWMTEEYELCARDCRTLLHHQLATPDFKDKINYAPYRQFDACGRRVWSNLMSGDWAWKQADLISVNKSTHGAVYVPVVAGSDKTTVSVATGHQEYHPVYVSPGVITGIARRAHGNGVLPGAFLPIPKTTKKHQKTPAYQHFVRQMYHACLVHVFEPLKVAMETPEVVRCPDGHFRRVVYGLGPYIADYPEQVWLSCIVQNWCPKCDAKPDNLDTPGALPRKDTKTEFLVTCFDPGTLWDDFGIRSDMIPFTRDFPRADIHELLSPDLLHQVIKGTFKDHLVEWVNKYLHTTHGEKKALEIIADIDHRISAVPSFPGLRRFPDGRDFSQWTGDDSKALMKVYIAAIAGHVPSKMVKCMAAFMDFCYLVRRNAINSDTLLEISDALTRFHTHRDIFIQTGVRISISLPRQHSLVHYLPSICLFGSPNGLCSSITESKHIKAVKEPWRRSSRYKVLIQMLRIICRLDKMAALLSIFAIQGMMAGSASSYEAMVLRGESPKPPGAVEDDEDEDDHGDIPGPQSMSSIELARTREHGYLNRLNALADVPLDDCPRFDGRINVHHSAIAHYYAPSDLCGAGRMHREHIRSNPRWHGTHPRWDTVLVTLDSELPGMLGRTVGRVFLFFSFTHIDTYYRCALVQWFPRYDTSPDPDTGLWLDSIARGVHLLPVYGSAILPENFEYSYSLDSFRAFFFNRYADHHMHELLV